MNILVCIKQVPGSSNVEVDPETGVLIRSRTDNKMNPYDLFAIETALTLRSAWGGQAAVLTMGPPQAREALEEAVYMGADRGFLLTDSGFAGSDVLATSYALSQGIRQAGEFDLILCGKQTTDGDTAQVGAEVAELLDIPHIAGVSAIQPREDGCLEVRSNLDRYTVVSRIFPPCLLCVDGDVNTPRLPSFRRQLELGAPPIETLSIRDLRDADPTRYGIQGSPTQVERIFPPEKHQDKRLVEGNGEMLAEFLHGVLRERKLIQEVDYERSAH